MDNINTTYYYQKQLIDGWKGIRNVAKVQLYNLLLNRQDIDMVFKFHSGLSVSRGMLSCYHRSYMLDWDFSLNTSNLCSLLWLEAVDI